MKVVLRIDVTKPFSPDTGTWIPSEDAKKVLEHLRKVRESGRGSAASQIRWQFGNAAWLQRKNSPSIAGGPPSAGPRTAARIRYVRTEEWLHRLTVDQADRNSTPPVDGDRRLELLEPEIERPNSPDVAIVPDVSAPILEGFRAFDFSMHEEEQRLKETLPADAAKTSPAKAKKNGRTKNFDVSLAVRPKDRQLDFNESPVDVHADFRVPLRCAEKIRVNDRSANGQKKIGRPQFQTDAEAKVRTKAKRSVAEVEDGIDIPIRAKKLVVLQPGAGKIRNIAKGLSRVHVPLYTVEVNLFALR